MWPLWGEKTKGGGNCEQNKWFQFNFQSSLLLLIIRSIRNILLDGLTLFSYTDLFGQFKPPLEQTTQTYFLDKLLQAKLK